MITRLRNQMDRLFNAHVSLIYEKGQDRAAINSVIADRAEFWWNPRKPDEAVLWESKIELGEKLYNEIINRPMPFDMNVLREMKRSPLGLDLYMWLTYRTFNLDGPKRLPWSELYIQFGADPAKADDRRTVDNWRTDCLRELRKLKGAWPGLRYATPKGVLEIWPSSPLIAPRGR